MLQFSSRAHDVSQLDSFVNDIMPEALLEDVIYFHMMEWTSHIVIVLNFTAAIYLSSFLIWT